VSRCRLQCSMMRVQGATLRPFRVRQPIVYEHACWMTRLHFSLSAAPNSRLLAQIGVALAMFPFAARQNKPSKWRSGRRPLDRTSRQGWR
jgi:hypothetical protein